MGSIQPIIDEILAEAKEMEASIRLEAEEELKRLRLEFSADSEALRTDFEKKLEYETDIMYKKAEALKNRMMRDAVLSAKTHAIDRACRTAIAKIADLPENRYRKILSDMYKKNQTGGVIYLSERDQKRMKASDFQGAVISDKAIKCVGGFLQVIENISYNCTLEAVLEERYSLISDRLAGIFTEEVL